MFSKILIANRGAIACRILRSLKKMNIASVAVFAESDRDSLHVAQADEAYCLGDGAANTTYLDQEKIIAIARACGAQAIHPGYGFLSENANFVALCQQHNITFIGPSVANMQAFALKHTARELAERYQVPLVPGSGILANIDDALAAAENIGYPIILKSSAGGGGIGMQICSSAKDLTLAYDSVVRLSENNFSDGRVFIEKYIEHARHIEVQVFGNGQGLAVDIGERDCSLQRRNQKVIEEAPAANLPDAIRAQLLATAVRLLGGVNYANAGTVEFIYDTRENAFYFLEVNTRLQVEHGISEEVYGVDLVAWMIEQAYAPLVDLQQRRACLIPKGHAIEVRIYAENPNKQFQPSAGLLSHVYWPALDGAELDRGEVDAPPAAASALCASDQSRIRVDTWIQSGTEVPVYFDPMLAKVIVWAKDRQSARKAIKNYLKHTEIYGIDTNRDYAMQLLSDNAFKNVRMHTRYLDSWRFHSSTIEILRPGTMTTVQDLPGRIGYWEVGVPPSGPFDAHSFRLGNQLLENSDACAGLEITVSGPRILFHCASRVVVCGAEIPIELDGTPQAMWQVLQVHAGQELDIGKISTSGTRAYLLIHNGIQCPLYLGSRSTFSLGQFGGHNGRALRTGDVLTISEYTNNNTTASEGKCLALEHRPQIKNTWVLNAIYGPHGAPDFFTSKDIDTFFASEWEVHYNSSRTGIRLVGPKPEWARETGGEAGMHPSNIHDNAYAFGSVDFTGDMPVILGPDGPSLGGFVCPATVIHADLWKLGQLRAGDKVRFNPVTLESALAQAQNYRQGKPLAECLPRQTPGNCVIQQHSINEQNIAVRLAGDRFLLIEFGEQVLDLRLRFQVHALREFLQTYLNKGVLDLTPGIRSLQVHFDPHHLCHEALLAIIEQGLHRLESFDDLKVPSRIVHLPLSWDDEACGIAIKKYTQSVRADAPWCPSNIEFIRRINGLLSMDDVRDIVFGARYVVMGLGDVYLGAPVATPMDPRHRMVTTKYNPARTWTAENSVGIGGAYLCVYGMEGPGGYQFVGRTLQMWNRYYKTREFTQPWLLRFFDQIKFFPVSQEELVAIRREFPHGRYPLKIEQTQFSLRDYEHFLTENAAGIQAFERTRQAAFDAELQRWRESGEFHFDSSQELSHDEGSVPEGLTAIDSSVAGSIWKILVTEGQRVAAGAPLLILESMKMEIEIVAQHDGVVQKIMQAEGAVVSAGQAILYLHEDH